MQDKTFFAAVVLDNTFADRGGHIDYNTVFVLTFLKRLLSVFLKAMSDSGAAPPFMNVCMA